MNTLTWVISTSAICWTGICLYLVYLGCKQHSLTRRINQLASRMEHAHDE